MQKAIEENKDIISRRVVEIMENIDKDYLAEGVSELIYSVISDRLLGKVV